MSRPHQDLDAWKVGMSLARAVYRATGQMPTDERFGLTSQMRRAAVSVPSNVAEGAARGSQREFAQFLFVSRGSLAELQTQLLLAEQLELIPSQPKLHKLIEDEYGLLCGLINHLKRTSDK